MVPRGRFKNSTHYRVQPSPVDLKNKKALKKPDLIYARTTTLADQVYIIPSTLSGMPPAI